MEDLSLHILDIAENAITAGATRINIRIVEDLDANLFLMEISDNGRGMDKEMYEHACDPFYTTRTTRKVGLGIPLLAQAARDCRGDIKIKTEKGKEILRQLVMKSDVLIIDEIGYTPIDRKEANLFFNLISEVYERSSVVITSNKDFEEWAEMMGDQIMTTAMLDRLLHHAQVFSLSGDSYRIQHRKEE